MKQMTGRLLQLWLAGMMMLLLAGCLPRADFSFSPETPKAGEQINFDASGSMGINTKITRYDWSFGDTQVASGVVAKHAYDQAGTYTVTLTVTDNKGQTSAIKKQVIVQASGTGQLSVHALSSDGVPLIGASVESGSQSATSDSNGVANLSGLGTGEQVVRVSKSGFITQVIRATPGTSGGALAVLQPVKTIKTISQAEQAQLISADLLGASVLLPAQALVAPDGSAVTGQVTVRITPWDITSRDLDAMLGNGRAKDASGQATDLISAGMMTVDFYDAQNRHLQLASGKTAVIQIDLPRSSINGQALAVGSTIPLWHFDESQGLWIADGTGKVVASNTSSTGLAVAATVSHFSTWNWDFKFQNGGSVQVSCQTSAGQLQACDVVAEVTLDDGSIITRNTSLAAEVTTVVNMPSSGKILWKAQTTGGLIGQVQSGTSGTVIINLGTPATNNFVQCVQKDGTAIPCKVEQSIQASDGTVHVNSLYVPVEGARIMTPWTTSTAINWQAISRMPVKNAAGQWVRLSGTLATAATGAAVITLDQETLLKDKLVRLQCNPTALFNSAPFPITSCDITVSFVYRERTLWQTSQTVPTGVFWEAALPEGSFPDDPEVLISANSSDPDNRSYSFYEWYKSILDLPASLVMQLTGGT